MGLMERNISLINPVQFEADENLDERDDLFVSCASQTIEGLLCTRLISTARVYTVSLVINEHEYA